MIDLRTRHSFEFNLVSDRLDSDVFPYADCYPDYVDKRTELGQLMGTNDFIWCIPASRIFRHYEMIKPVEWIVQICDERILGYVHDQHWFDFLQGTRLSLKGVYTKKNPPQDEFSVLVQYPLHIDEVKQINIFRITDPDHADVVEDVAIASLNQWRDIVELDHGRLLRRPHSQ